MKTRLSGDLDELHVVSVIGRPKTPDSSLQKLHTGKFVGVDDLTDLVGLTVVLLYRREIQDAIHIVKTAGLTVIDEQSREIEPSDFSYREPKLFVKPPRDYLERNPDVADIVCELQFTTALQHALDMTTHDFDYKGKTYDWGNFRLVAQLRGMLELVDQMIDDIDDVSIAAHELVAVPSRFVAGADLISVLEEYFIPGSLPADRRRLADTVGAWTSAARLTPRDLHALLSRHSDLVAAESIDPTSAVLGALLRENARSVLANFSGRFYISGELESICEEARAVPSERRTAIG